MQWASHRLISYDWSLLVKRLCWLRNFFMLAMFLHTSYGINVSIVFVLHIYTIYISTQVTSSLSLLTKGVQRARKAMRKMMMKQMNRMIRFVTSVSCCEV